MLQCEPDNDEGIWFTMRIFHAKFHFFYRTQRMERKAAFSFSHHITDTDACLLK
jgi:hypothetical protein